MPTGLNAWSTTPGNNATIDQLAQFPPGMPANAVDGAVRGLMASLATTRDDNLGVALVTIGGTNNAFALSTGQNLIDPASTAGAGTPRITHPFSLRIVFNAAPTGMATNPPTLAIDGAAPATLVKADGSALVDGDLGTAKSYEIIGTTFVSGALTSIRIRDLMPSDMAASGAAVSGLVPSGIGGSNGSAVLTLGPGSRLDSTGTKSLSLTSSKTWAVTNGNAANGYQGGSTLPAFATIHLFLMSGSAGTDLFASQSLTPTLPSGYSVYGRACSFTTDANGAPLAYAARLQPDSSLICMFSTAILDASGLALSTTPLWFPTSVPIGLSHEWLGGGYYIGPAPSQTLFVVVRGFGDAYVAFTSGSQPVAAPMPDVFISTGGNPATNEFASRRRFTDPAGRLQAWANQPTGGVLYLETAGFIDGRMG